MMFLLVSCEKQEQRYFAGSAETKTFEEAVAAYESGNWEAWQGHFSDTAKIYVNSKDHVSVSDRVKELKELTAQMSSYGFDKEDQYIEMVIDKKKEKWVYYWAHHKGTLAANNKELSIPVHIAVQFTDGKITAEHVYFDGTEFSKALEEIAAANAEKEASESNEM